MSAVVLLQIASSALLNGAFAWLAGSVLARAWLAQSFPFPDRGEPLAAALGVAGVAAALWAACALMGDVALHEVAPMLPMMLTSTAYGHAGLAGMAALCGVGVLAACPRAWRGRAAVRGPIALLLGVFALSRAAVSHAGEHGLLSLAVAIEWLHLAAVGAWVGGVALAAWVIVPRLQEGANDAQSARYLEALSRAATIALALIVATGVYNALQRIGALRELTDNAFGMALTVKVVLVAAAVALGGYNKLVGFPAAVRSPAGLARALFVLRVESFLLLGVLLAAAVLTSSPPPG